jgi:hypothetical protein
MALYLAQARAVPHPTEPGRQIRAMVVCDDKAPAGSRALCSLPARLNGGEIPSVRALRGIVRGDSILAAKDEAVQAIRGQRKTLAYEFVVDCHMGRVFYNETAGDYTARIYEEATEFSWSFYEPLGVHENLFDAIAAVQRYFGLDQTCLYHATRADGTTTNFDAVSLEAARAYCPAAVRIVNTDVPGEEWSVADEARASLVYASRRRAELLRRQETMRDPFFRAAYNAYRARGFSALAAFRSAQAHGRYNGPRDIRTDRAARILADSLETYAQNRALCPEDTPRGAWAAAFSLSRLDNPRPL